MAALKAWLGVHLALDGDALVVADLWNRLQSGGHLGAWTMGPQPYLFPDVLIYGISAQCCPDPVGRQACCGMIFGFLVWWFLARLMKRLWNLDGSAARAYAAAGLLLLLPFLNGANGLDGALVPGYHGGALLCCLAFLTWALGQDKRLSSWIAVLWAALWTGLTWASDQIVPAWVLLPALTLSLGLSGKARRRIWSAAALSVGVRYATLWYWKRLGMQIAHFQWSYFAGHGAAMLDAFTAQALAAFKSPSWAAVLGAAVLVLLLGRFRTRPLDGWFALAVALMVLSGFGVSALGGQFTGRYFIAFIWLSVPLLPLELSRMLEGKPLPLLAAGLFGLLYLDSLRPLALPVLGRVQWVQAQLAPRGLKSGLADYDSARQLNVLSEGDLQVAPATVVSGRLQPYVWMVDRGVFSSGTKVQFVVPGGLDPQAIRTTLGSPSQVLRGPGTELWLYSGAVPSRRPG
ncbi:MAG TPA: hypothetical protein VK914_09605 [bacterium]|nr:hypothetical protein [bacterium]